VRVALLIALVLAATAAPAAGAIRIDDRLHFSRPDGTPIRFPPPVRVWCGAWAPDVPVPAIHVVGGRRGHDARVWSFDTLLRERSARLPDPFVWDQPHGAILFAAAGGNEASSAEEEGRGRLSVERASCDQGLRLRFRVDARLGSELSGRGRIRVRGRFGAAEV
jgi:hypothetical protein